MALPEKETRTRGSAAGRLVLNIMAAVSQWEREAIGERTRDALRHKRSNGERVGNIQFGYRLCADRRHVEPDPGEQAVLTEIQNLRHSGQTLRGIAATLNHRALRTRRGSAWRLEHVARLENALTVLVFWVHAQNQHGEFGAQCLKISENIEAASPGHCDIQD
jgi:DNA invertase Pin-like site-specific DNA recombinase